MSEDYGVSKAPTVSQSLPAFSQPYSTRFPRYSPPYTSQQGNTVADVAASWASYAPAAESALSSQYAAVVTSSAGRGRQSGSTAASTNAPTQAQHQLSAAASLSASEFLFLFWYNNCFCVYDRFFEFFLDFEKIRWDFIEK